MTPVLGEDKHTYQSNFGPTGSWGQTSGQTAGHIHQQKLHRKEYRERALQFGATADLTMLGLTELKPKVASVWPNNNTGTKSCPQ